MTNLVIIAMILGTGAYSPPATVSETDSLNYLAPLNLTNTSPWAYLEGAVLNTEAQYIASEQRFKMEAAVGRAALRVFLERGLHHFIGDAQLGAENKIRVRGRNTVWWIRPVVTNGVLIEVAVQGLTICMNP